MVSKEVLGGIVEWMDLSLDYDLAEIIHVVLRVFVGELVGDTKVGVFLNDNWDVTRRITAVQMLVLIYGFFVCI